MRLKGKVGIVTGAGAGIGRAIASGFASEGATVVIAEVDAQSGLSTEEAIRKSGGNACFLPTDVSDEQQIKFMVEQTLARFGRIDVLCNNTGVLLFDKEAPAHELSTEAWDRTMAVNLRGYWLTSKYVFPAMLHQKSGSIIHIASPTGLFGFTRSTAYSASKGGVLGLMRAMAADYGPEHIRVNGIIPGTIDTPMNAPEFTDLAIREQWAQIAPARRLGVPEDIAWIAVYLASEESSYCVGDLHGRRWLGRDMMLHAPNCFGGNACSIRKCSRPGTTVPGESSRPLPFASSSLV
ncbi:MAG: SDR family NAD(P)-dependent oxidoreductase [Terracidiphilus sp.]